MLKRPGIYLAACLASGCGGNSGDPPPAGSGLVKTISVSADANGCLLSSNAEAVVNYTIGSRQAKNLVWNCAIYNGADRQVETFVKYDDAFACMRIVATIDGAPNCAFPAVVPGSPILSVEITENFFTALHATGGGWYGTYSTATIKNTGNLTAFEVASSMEATPYSDFVTHPLGNLRAGESVVDNSELARIDPNGQSTVTVYRRAVVSGALTDTVFETKPVP